MVNFQGKNWYLTVTRNISLFTSTLDVVGHYFYSRKYDLIPRESLIIVKNGRQASVFINKENIFKYHQQLEKVCLSPKRLRKIEAAYYKFGNNLLKASNLLEKNLTRQSFQNFIKAYSYLAAGLYLTIGIGRHMSELLVTKLKKIYPTISQKDLDILISEITYSPKFTPLTKSQLSLLEIGAELQKEKIEPQEIMTQPKIYKKFKDHIKKYSAIPVNFTEEPWTEKEILDQLKNLMKTDCQKEKENILKQHEMKIKKSKEVLAKIKNKEIKNIVNSLKVGTFLNEYRKYIFCQANLAYRPLFQKIAERYKLSNWRECFKFTPHEIINLYFNQKLQILNILPERNLAGIVFAKNKNGYRLLSKKEITLFLPEIKKITSKEEITEVQEIKGTIANSGIVRGIAKIILQSSDFDKFNDGDVIVTTMTSVDFVPLMKRASAFITNEGGITSHAAVVSRELNKPCIIGTKIATKVLKDGDLVEVDANKGVVRILK